MCNRCDIIVRVFEDAQRVSVLADQSCGECDAQMVKVEYKEGKSKLPGENNSFFSDTSMTSHFFFFSQMIRLKRRAASSASPH